MSYEEERHHRHDEPEAVLEVMSAPWPSRIDVHIHLPAGGGTTSPDVAALLQQILAKLTTQQGELDHMSAELDDLAVAVSENTDIDQSAIQLLNELADKLDAAAADPAAVAALAADIRSSSAGLAAAVTANTPAAPAPVEPPAEPPA